jgi:hypothetical protein
MHMKKLLRRLLLACCFLAIALPDPANSGSDTTPHGSSAWSCSERTPTIRSQDVAD